MAVNGECLHEEQIQNQSRKIERLETRADYKHERMAELNDKMDRITEKIDHLTESMNDLTLQATKEDKELELRLKAIETKQQVLEEQNDKNRDVFNTRLAIVAIVLTCLTIYLNYFR